ncbi:MAG: hypothetical protein IPJ03_03055 [Ignavibacteriales bacterium]|nr:hypothetical protein [Ignavibacteriales bacterium]
MYEHIRIKKIIVLLLTSLLIYHSGGFILIYTPASFLIKKVTKELIRSEMIDFPVVKFSFSLEEINSGIEGLHWIHEKEFRYNGNMYDIVKKETTGDRVIYYCFADKKEDLLETSFEVHFQNGKETKSLESNTHKINLLSLSDWIAQPANCRSILFALGYLFPAASESELTPFLNVITPPPKNIFS